MGRKTPTSTALPSGDMLVMERLVLTPFEVSSSWSSSRRSLHTPLKLEPSAVERRTGCHFASSGASINFRDLILSVTGGSDGRFLIPVTTNPTSAYVALGGEISSAENLLGCGALPLTGYSSILRREPASSSHLTPTTSCGEAGPPTKPLDDSMRVERM